VMWSDERVRIHVTVACWLLAFQLAYDALTAALCQSKWCFATSALWQHHLAALQSWQLLILQRVPSTWPACHCCQAAA